MRPSRDGGEKVGRANAVSRGFRFSTMELKTKFGQRQTKWARWHGQPIVRWRGCSRLQSYMQFPIPQITTLMLLVHLSLGCCWHHSHSIAANCCSPPIRHVHTCCGHHHEPSPSLCRQYDDGPNRNDDTPPPHHCDGERCSFVWWKPSAKQKGEGSLAIGTFDATVASFKPARSLSHQILGKNGSACQSNVRLRAHLLFNVLLI